MKASLSATQSTPTTTSSKLWPSSPPFAVRLTSRDRLLSKLVSASWPQFSLTGVKRLARGVQMMENSGRRPFTGLKKSAAAAPMTPHATTKTEAGLVLMMHGPHSQVNNTMDVVPSNFHGTTTMAVSPQSSLQAHITTRCSCSRIRIWSTKMAISLWLQESGST